MKVLDFGLAKAFDAELSTAPPSQIPTATGLATGGGMILGTAPYMSPEQARGQVIDRTSDVWAFGCVLYEMLVGKPAFEGDTVTDILAAVVSTEPDWTALPRKFRGYAKAVETLSSERPEAAASRHRRCSARA